MAEMIPEPAESLPGTEDWQDLLRKLTFTTGGLLLVDISNRNTYALPEILPGTRIEINSSFYIARQIEEVQVPNTIIDGRVFIYAIPMEDYCYFELSNVFPVMDMSKGGLYNGTHRAIVTMRRIMDLYYEKQILYNNAFYETRETGPFIFTDDGQLKFRIPTLTTDQEARTESGDIWFRG